MTSFLISVDPAATQSQSDMAKATAQASTASWRLELERAQWAQLSHEKSRGPVSSAEGTVAPGQEAVRLSRGKGSQAVTPALHDRREAQISQDSATPDAGEAREGQQDLIGKPRADADVPQATAPPALDFNASVPVEEAPETLAIAVTRPPPRQQWSLTNVHAFVSGNEAQVWVRDAMIDPMDRSRVATELRSRLRPAGVKLSLLVVNGEAVLAGPPSTPKLSDEVPSV